MKNAPLAGERIHNFIRPRPASRRFGGRNASEAQLATGADHTRGRPGWSSCAQGAACRRPAGPFPSCYPAGAVAAPGRGCGRRRAAARGRAAQPAGRGAGDRLVGRPAHRPVPAHHRPHYRGDRAGQADRAAVVPLAGDPRPAEGAGAGHDPGLPARPGRPGRAGEPGPGVAAHRRCAQNWHPALAWRS
jgi:hypothetical protein